MTESDPSMEQIKLGMRAMWMAGDFGVVAREIGATAGEPFAARVKLQAEDRVLDVACGTGNVALPLARRGAAVWGVDLAPNLLAQARARAKAEGLTVQFDEGDAEQLPYGDESFDVAVSMFGAMFAPRPDVVTAELARVVRGGGQLQMGNWTPAGFSGQMFREMAKHIPPPPGIAPPVLWGEERVVRERLKPFFREVQTETVAMDFSLATDAAGAVTFFRTYFGPTMVAFDRLDEAGREGLARDLEALWAGANVAETPATQVLIRNEYLLVTATRR